MLYDAIGPPQIAALLVLGQRGLEELYSTRNSRRLLAEGAREAGRDFYPVVATAQLGWLASVFFLVPATASVSWLGAGAYLMLQGLRYWIIASLGKYWTHRIITQDGAPVVREGPYRLMRHPNYAVMMAEIFLLPAMFGAWALAFIITAISWSVNAYKVVLEDDALEARRRATGEPIR